jgi:hypothetical protein
MGIGDWGLGIGDWAQSPIPNSYNALRELQSNFLSKNNLIIMFPH